MVRLPDAAGQFQNAGNGRNSRNSRTDRNRTVPNIPAIPVRVLRGFFAGVGQLLLAADRLREAGAERDRNGQDEQFDPPTGLDGEPPASHERAEGDARAAAPVAGGRAGAGHRPPKVGAQSSDARSATRPRAARRGQPAMPRFRSLDATGNVRILTPDMPAETPGAARPKAASRPKGKTARRSRSVTASRAVAADLPVPGYDALSLPSIRARLRGLDVAQLRVLCDHEKSGARRADVVTMLERRIAKLEAAARDAT